MIDPESRHTTENLLVQRYRRRDRDALAALIRKFHPKLLRMIVYQLGDSRPVEDIAQDCWYAIIKQLPPTGRIILEMFYLDHMSLRIISEALNIPEGTVKSRLFHARENLKKIITKQKET